MSSPAAIRRVLVPALACSALLLFGCSAKKPTQPKPAPPTAGGGGAPSVTYSITVNATATSLQAGTASPTVLTVNVRQQSDGLPPADGTTLLIRTNLGEFGTAGSGVQEAPLSLVGGAAQVQLFPGNAAGTANVRAQLRNDVGGIDIVIRGQTGFLISSVQPNSGGLEGGTRVSVRGAGFAAPLRVFFAFGGSTAQANVVSVSTNEIVITTPPFRALSNTVTGDFNTVDVTVENDLSNPGNNGQPATARLIAGFTYINNVPPLRLDRVSPAQGDVSGGEAITLFGGGFVGTLTVDIGGRSAFIQQTRSDRLVVTTPPADVPAGQTQVVSITVTRTISGSQTGSQGTTTATLNNVFTYGYFNNPFFIEQVQPATGAARGGETVQLIGGGFVSPVRVFFGDNPATVVGVTSATITVTTPSANVQPGASLVVDVRVDNDINSGQPTTATLPNGFTYVRDATDNFFLQTVDPNAGDAAGGESVDIVGGGFMAPVRVTFGALPATIQNITPTRITVLTPPLDIPIGSSQTVNVTVENSVNSVNSATETLNNAFTYRGGGVNPVPAILSVVPNSGPNEGGTVVTIRGTGFKAPVQVLFGQGTNVADFSGVEASVESVSSTEIRVRSPAATGFGQANQNQTVNILVRNLDFGTSDVATNAFTYGVAVIITSVGPSFGPYFGGTNVTLFGQGFDEPVAVVLAGFAQNVISVTGTEIIARTIGITTDSCADVSGPVSVTNVETGDSADGGTWTYEVTDYTPRIAGLSPTSGPQTGGTVVTLTGSNFIAPLSVVLSTSTGQMGAQSFQANAQVLSVNTQGGVVTIQMPSLPRNAFATEDCDDNADGTSGERFIPTAFDLLITNNATTCNSSFLRAFTYIPSDSTCRNDQAPVTPPDPPVAAFDFAVLDAATHNIQFQDMSTGGPTSWLWDFGDGTNSLMQFPTHMYAMAGNYSVTLTVSNSGGSSSTNMVIAVP